MVTCQPTCTSTTARWTISGKILCKTPSTRIPSSPMRTWELAKSQFQLTIQTPILNHQLTKVQILSISKTWIVKISLQLTTNKTKWLNALALQMELVLLILRRDITLLDRIGSRFSIQDRRWVRKTTIVAKLFLEWSSETMKKMDKWGSSHLVWIQEKITALQIQPTLNQTNFLKGCHQATKMTKCRSRARTSPLTRIIFNTTHNLAS